MKRQYNVEKEDIRAQLFLDVLSCLWRYNDAEKKAVAEEAQVTWQTLYNWCSNKTQNPHISTLTRVAEALGFTIVLKRVAKTPKRKPQPRRKSKARLRRVK